MSALQGRALEDWLVERKIRVEPTSDLSGLSIVDVVDDSIDGPDDGPSIRLRLTRCAAGWLAEALAAYVAEWDEATGGPFEHKTCIHD